MICAATQIASERAFGAETAVFVEASQALFDARFFAGRAADALAAPDRFRALGTDVSKVSRILEVLRATVIVLNHHSLGSLVVCAGVSVFRTLIAQFISPLVRPDVVLGSIATIDDYLIFYAFARC